MPTTPRDPIRFNIDADPLPAPAWFAPELEAMGVTLDAGDAERLGRFLAIMLDANTRCNLTAITNPDEAWRKHIFDALTLAPVLSELPEAARVADVGSGGGVPAIPLAICMPALRFTLIEATGKKAEFLRVAARALALTHVEVRNERAEEVGQEYKSGAGRESYDAVLARALGRLNVALELTAPLAREGGLIILVKGEKADEELAEASRAMGELRVRHAGTIQTPTSRVVVLEKVGKTPRTYPRPSGEPKRKPLT